MDPEHWYGDIFSAYEHQKVLLSVKVEGGGIYLVLSKKVYYFLYKLTTKSAVFALLLFLVPNYENFAKCFAKTCCETFR
jgi:hypothetical protein